MTRIRMFALIAAAFASPAISTELVWAQSRTEVIAQRGQVAPDGNGTFQGFTDPMLNNSGQVVFDAALAGTSGGTSDNTGIFLGNGGSITQIVRKGQSAPDANGTFIDFGSPALNDSGQAAFGGFLTGTSGGFSDNAGIFRGSGGSITQIARKGQSAPDGNGTFTSVSLRSLNNASQAAFHGFLTGTSGGSSDDTGIFRGSGGSITQIVRAGQSAPDGNGTFLNLHDPVLNNAGQAAFYGSLTGTSGGFSDYTGIFRGSGGSITQIARLGQSAPDSNGNFSFFDSRPALNDSGQAAFYAELTGTSGGASDNQGIFRGSGGSITQIARRGQFAPDANGTFSYFGSPELNNAGQVAFSASLTGTSGRSSDDTGIFRGSGGSITQIARKGQSAPDANGTFTSFLNPQLNDAGQVAFSGSLTGTSDGFSDNEGIFTSDGIDTFQVIREGDSLGGGIVSGAIAAFSLNQHGQIAYKATLIGGNQVIGRWTPELHWRNPSSSTWDTTGRWTLGLHPGNPHDVFIDPAASLTVTGPATNTTVRSLLVGGGAGLATLNLRNGAALTATDGFTVASKGTLTGDGAIVGDVTNLGTVTANNITVTGTLINGGVIRGTGIIDANIVNSISGKVRAIGGDQLRLSGASLVNFGLVEINASELQIDGQLNNEYSTGLVSIRNGTLIADSGIANQGGIAMTQGYSQIFGDITNLGGTVQVSGGAHATFYGDFLQTGLLQVATVGNTNSVAVFLGGFGGSGGFTGGGDVFVLGDLRPGDSPASVLYDGNLFLGNSTNTFIELGGLGLGEFDQMRVTGDLNLSGDLFVSLIDEHTLELNQQYLIGEIGGDLFGHFNGLGEGDLVGIIGGQHLFISYTAGNGNDVALFTAIPEPGTCCMLSAFALAVMVRRRRRCST